MTVLITVPIAAFTLPAIPCHTVFRDDHFVVRPYASVSGRIYEYADVRRLTATGGFRDRDDNFHADPCIVIDMKDGTRWSSGDNLRDPDLHPDYRLVSS